MIRSSAVAYERAEGARLSGSFLVTAGAWLRRAAHFLRAVGEEAGNIPGYQDEAVRLMEELRGRHANSRARDRGHISNA